MAALHCTWISFFHHDSTSTLLHATLFSHWLYTWVYLCPLHFSYQGFSQFYLIPLYTLQYSTMALNHWLYSVLPWLYIMHSTGLYHPVAFILLDSTLSSTSLFVTLLYHVSPSHYFILLHHSIIALLDSTRLYIILPWLYFTLLDSIIFSTKVLLHFTCLYFTLPWFLVHNNSLLDSTSLYHGSTSLHLNPHHSTMGLLLSISLFNITFTLLVSTLLY